jgi:hypothetical protein
MALVDCNSREKTSVRTNEDIQGRIKQLLTKELEERLSAASVVLPVNCKYNLRHTLDVRHQVAGEINPQYNQVAKRHLPVIGLCMLGSEDPTNWPGNICEDPIDAQTCPAFDPLRNRQKVQDEFQTQLKIPTWVRDNLPEVSELLWVLEVETAQPPQQPWWRKLLRKLLSYTTLPQLPSGD